MILFESVSKQFGPLKALDQVSFAIERGRITGLLGPNGSGKTTALRLLLGLYAPSHGKITVLSQAPGEAAADRIGYLPEERGLYRRMTVLEVITYYAKLKAHAPTQAEIITWLERFEIAHHARQRIEKLSKGTSQKVQFIACVLHSPELLILDEPFSGLDPLSATVLREAILELARSGATVLLSTHDINLAERMCDAFLMLHKGRKVLDLSRAELEQRHGERSVKVSCEGPVPTLQGVRESFDFGSYRELLLQEGTDPQSLLRELQQQARVQRFEVSRPSLHDIFSRLARE